jgi:cell division GTPase FtsZ
LIGDVQTATYFIANIVGDASLMQMMEWASVLEQLVDENANIIWGVSLEEQTTETRMIVLGAHPWPSADGV